MATPDDYHDPLAGLGGAPPARSALGLRLALAVFGLAACVGGAIVLAVGTDGAGVLIALLCAAALVAVIDIAVVTRRIRRERDR